MFWKAHFWKCVTLLVKSVLAAGKCCQQPGLGDIHRRVPSLLSLPCPRSARPGCDVPPLPSCPCSQLAVLGSALQGPVALGKALPVCPGPVPGVHLPAAALAGVTASHSLWGLGRTPSYRGCSPPKNHCVKYTEELPDARTVCLSRDTFRGSFLEEERAERDKQQ